MSSRAGNVPGRGEPVAGPLNAGLPRAWSAWFSWTALTLCLSGLLLLTIQRRQSSRGGVLAHGLP